MLPVVEIFTVIVIGLGLVFLQTLLFCLVGASLFSNLLPRESGISNLYFRICWFFFIGLAVFLGYFRLCDFFIGDARVSILATVISAAIVFSIRWHVLRPIISGFLERFHLGPLFWIVVLSFGVAIFTLLVGTTSGVRQHWGSGHSDQYSKLAIFISEANFIPTLGRHYGQSILTAIGLILGLKKASLLLYLWLVVSKMMLVLLTFGFFSGFLYPRYKAVFATSLVFFGQTSLSLVWVHNIDSITPFVGSEYTDSMTGIGSMFALLVVLFQKSRGDIDTRLVCLLFFALCLFWAISMPINLVFGLVVFFIWFFGCRPAIRTKKQRFLLPALAVISVFVALSQGGSLTPKEMRTNHPFIAKMISTSGAVEYFPRLPYFYFSGKILGGDSWHHFTSDELNEDMNFLNSKNQFPAMHTEGVWNLESKVWTALRVQFFALIGLGIIGLNLIRRVPAAGALSSIIGTPGFIQAIAVVTVIGFGGSFLFALGDAKWPMSRLNIFGSFFGLLVTIIWVVERPKTTSWLPRIMSRFFCALAVVVMVFGPMTNFFLRVLNVSLVPDPNHLINELILEDSPSREDILRIQSRD